LSNYGHKGKITGDNTFKWHVLKEHDPMDFEDAWGTKVKQQFSLSLKENT